MQILQGTGGILHKARVHPVKIRHQRMANGIAAVPLIGVTLINPIVDMQRRACRPHFLSGAVQQRTNNLAPHRRNTGESSQPGAPSQAEQHGLHRIRKRMRRGDPITVQRLKKGVPRLPGIRLNAHTGSLGLSGCVDCFFKIRQMLPGAKIPHKGSVRPGAFAPNAVLHMGNGDLQLPSFPAAEQVVKQ